MIVRSVSALALLGMLAASPALAQGAVSPASVLAAKTGPKGAHGFADRTARIRSIMGPELSKAAPLNLQAKPAWKRPVRRDADATGGIR